MRTLDNLERAVSIATVTNVQWVAVTRIWSICTKIGRAGPIARQWESRPVIPGESP
jgi:hypothetical protein